LLSFTEEEAEEGILKEAAKKDFAVEEFIRARVCNCVFQIN